MLKIIKAGNHGILLPQLGIGLDYSGTEASHVFVSHGHADHIPRKASAVYATNPTRRFMKLRGTKYEVSVLDFFTPLQTGKATVTFFPAGHILGSAMTFVESEYGNLLYTGDYRTPPSPASEGFTLPAKPVDYFITEATFSLPLYKWQSYDQLQSQLYDFVSNALAEDYTPIFQAYNLGKAQELLFLLKDFNHPKQIHEAGFKLCEVYESSGFQLGDYEEYDPDHCEGKILVCPGSALRKGFASGIKKKRTAWCSGWAAVTSRWTQLSADKRIPLSDHLDFFELINLCGQINPRKVIITHTPNPKVVQHYLEQRDIDAVFLDEME